ncbi:NADP-dependent oxidoreductase domain-containing protein [Biscogniauxia mediterranea]|nr:NADP-dependent oxidoreductase domain-containing protein [Biscogniauxia mediterranea]
MACQQPLPRTGFGLLSFTWRPQAISDDQAFAAMKAAIDNGATVWSSSSIYGIPPEPPTADLLLLRRYFQKYPEDARKVTLFIREEMRAIWEECNQMIGGVKYIDIFGPARMNRKIPAEETIGALKKLQDEGKVGAVSLSELRVETIRRASAVCPIRFAVIEFSLWSTEMLDNGVAFAVKECNVSLMCYAPLGYGFLTGAIKKIGDIPEGDSRHKIGRFQPENFAKNLASVDKIKCIEKKKGVTPSQLALEWIRAQSNVGNCVERVRENCKIIEMSTRDKIEVDRILQSLSVAGHRQLPGMDHFLWT